MLPLIINLSGKDPAKEVDAFLGQLKANPGQEEQLPWADLTISQW